MERIRTIFLCKTCRTVQPDLERDDEGMVRNHQVNERSPLLLGSTSSTRILELRRQFSKFCDIFWIVFLFVLFFLGVTVGAYLLCTEDEEWTLPGRLDIISRDVWHANAPSLAMPELQLPVTDVVFVQTNSTGCHSEPSCAKLVLELQSKDMLERKQPDIMYNFIVTGYGGVYEGRGWNFQSGYKTSPYLEAAATTITLAFLGNFGETFPTRRQVQSAALFHEYALMEGYLAPCYRILVWGESRKLVDIAYNIQQQVKPKCEGLFSNTLT